MSTPTLAIEVHGKEYKVACPPAEQESLLAAAALLDQRMAAAAKGKMSGERLAVMVALNLAHDLLSQKAGIAPAGAASAGGDVESNAESLDSQNIARRIQAIESRIDSVLGT